MENENNFKVRVIKEDEDIKIKVGEIYEFIEGVTVWRNNHNTRSCTYTSYDNFKRGSVGDCFELVVEQTKQDNEYNLTIQDIINEKDYDAKYKIKDEEWLCKWNNRKDDLVCMDELIGDYGDYITENYSLKELFDMRFKKLEPKKIYIGSMSAVKRIKKNKLVWCTYKNTETLFNDPNTNKVKIDMLLEGKWYYYEEDK